MRYEIRVWLEQSDADIDGAKFNFDGGKYYIAAFLCQQAVEKALKALFLHEKKGEIPQSHSLVYLASNTNVAQDYMSFLKELTPKFIDTRYPDASVDLPANIYDKENTQRLLEKSMEVLQWIKSQMK
ncbi:MAG: HEPN domain-containing protein [Nanobdellota archaeon]